MLRLIVWYLSVAFCHWALTLTQGRCLLNIKVFPPDLDDAENGRPLQEKMGVNLNKNTDIDIFLKKGKDLRRKFS